MKKNVLNIEESEKDIADLVVMSNSSFELEIYFENEFIDKRYLLPGSRIRLNKLTKGDKVIIKSFFLNER